MPAELYSESAIVEPLVPQTEPERGDWAERTITLVATGLGVLIVAAVAVIVGVG